MLSRKFRLSLKKDFDQILKSKSKFYSYNFVLRFKKTQNPLSRFAVVASKKVSKKAVIRNRIKRRIVEIIRLNMSKICNGYDIMFFVKSDVSKIEHQKLQEEILLLFKKARILL